MADENDTFPLPAAPIKDAPGGAAAGAGGGDFGSPPSDTMFEPAEPLQSAGVEFDSAGGADEGASKASPSQLFKDGASKISKEAGDKVRSYAEEGMARAGGALDELARMLTDAAGTVDEKLGGQYGQYARSAAETVTGFSESVKNKQVDDLVGDAREFAKKSPAIAIGTAAALGFVLVRLIKSGLDATTDDAKA